MPRLPLSVVRIWQVSRVGQRYQKSLSLYIYSCSVRQRLANAWHTTPFLDTQYSTLCKGALTSALQFPATFYSHHYISSLSVSRSLHTRTEMKFATGAYIQLTGALCSKAFRILCHAHNNASSVCLMQSLARHPVNRSPLLNWKG
jgi:hypothetical protein